jgi:hypothetical protein
LVPWKVGFCAVETALIRSIVWRLWRSWLGNHCTKWRLLRKTIEWNGRCSRACWPWWYTSTDPPESSARV